MARKKRQQKSATLQVTGLSHEGRGISKADGKITFVFGALPDETVNVLYTCSRGKFDEADTTDVITPAKNRVSPPCEYFTMCGGCSLQHLKHEDQLRHKQASLGELLLHQAGTVPQEWLAPITDQTLGYRRKARLSVRHVPGKQKVLVGFRERNSRFVANIDHCAVLHPSVGKHLTDMSDMLYTLEQRDHIPQIEVAITDTATALIIRHLESLAENDLNILRKFADQFNYYIYLQPKGVDSIHLFHPNKDDDKLSYTLQQDNLTLRFHPAQFTQINQPINDKMITQAIKLLDLQPTDNVLDLFCGIGNFSLPAAKHSHTVIGIEGANDAVEQAKQNAKLNNINNTTFHTANLFNDCSHFSWATQRYDKLIIDPPRSGAEQVLAMLSHWQPHKIAYVSCNPSTLARDTKHIIFLWLSADIYWYHGYVSTYTACRSNGFIYKGFIMTAPVLHKQSNQWLEQVYSVHPNLNKALLEKACQISEKIASQTITPYANSTLTQGLQLADILLGLECDAHTIAAAILYPGFYYGQTSKETLCDEVGTTVYKLLTGTQRMESTYNLRGESQNHVQLDNLRKMFLAIVEDVRVVLIKLAEQLTILMECQKMHRNLKEHI